MVHDPHDVSVADGLTASNTDFGSSTTWTRETSSPTAFSWSVDFTDSDRPRREFSRKRDSITGDWPVLWRWPTGREGVGDQSHGFFLKCLSNYKLIFGRLKLDWQTTGLFSCSLSHENKSWIKMCERKSWRRQGPLTLSLSGQEEVGEKERGVKRSTFVAPPSLLEFCSLSLTFLLFIIDFYSNSNRLLVCLSWASRSCVSRLVGRIREIARLILPSSLYCFQRFFLFPPSLPSLLLFQLTLLVGVLSILLVH